MEEKTNYSDIVYEKGGSKLFLEYYMYVHVFSIHLYADIF
jgi:hypothetical protein